MSDIVNAPIPIPATTPRSLPKRRPRGQDIARRLANTPTTTIMGTEYLTEGEAARQLDAPSAACNGFDNNVKGPLAAHQQSYLLQARQHSQLAQVARGSAPPPPPGQPQSSQPNLTIQGGVRWVIEQMETQKSPGGLPGFSEFGALLKNADLF